MLCNETISIKSPVEFDLSDLVIAPEFENIIHRVSLYDYSSNPTLKIKIKCIEYASGFEGDLNELESATEAEIKEMGGEEITVKSKPYEISDMKGIAQEGWMTVDNMMYDFMKRTYAQQNKVWSIFVMHEQHDMYGYVVADKLIQSIAAASAKEN